MQQHSGVTGQLIAVEGVCDDKGKPVTDKKTKLPKQTGDPQWLLFEKSVRDNTSDNVFSAFPGARKKGTKNKVLLVPPFLCFGRFLRHLHNKRHRRQWLARTQTSHNFFG